LTLARPSSRAKPVRAKMDRVEDIKIKNRPMKRLLRAWGKFSSSESL